MSDELGARIRTARLTQGLSLRTTATAADISPSLLSQVETGKVQPSVRTLYAIVSFLGVSVDELLDHRPAMPHRRQNVTAGPVLRSEETPSIGMENGVTWHGLAVLDPSEKIDALRATYQPGGASSIDGSHMRHEGVEYGYVIEGELTLKLEFDRYVMRPGDSFSFDSMRPHLYVNETDSVATGVWFVVGRRQGVPHIDDDAVRSVVDVLEVMGRTPNRVDN